VGDIEDRSVVLNLDGATLSQAPFLRLMGLAVDHDERELRVARLFWERDLDDLVEGDDCVVNGACLSIHDDLVGLFMFLVRPVFGHVLTPLVTI
jgi:hypothetical protein